MSREFKLWTFLQGTEYRVATFLAETCVIIKCVCVCARARACVCLCVCLFVKGEQLVRSITNSSGKRGK